MEKGNYFISKSESITEIQILKTEIDNLRTKIQELQNYLRMIKLSEAYRTITTIFDWDLYFSQAKEILEKQVNELSNEK